MGTFPILRNGKRASVTDANGNRGEMRYDGHDRQNRWVFPSKTMRIPGLRIATTAGIDIVSDK